MFKIYYYSPSSSANSLVHRVKLSLNNCMIKVESLYDSSSNVSPSEAMELVCKSNDKEDTGEISFIKAATVLSVVKEYGK